MEEKLDTKPHKHNSKNYSNCFIGSDCVSLLISLKFALTEEEAIDFGNQLIQYNIIQHIDKHHTFKNDNNLYYQFIDGYDSIEYNTNSTHAHDSRNSTLSISSDISITSSTSTSSRRIKSSRNLRLTATKSRHRIAGSNMTISSVSDLLSSGQIGQNYIRRKDVYFRVNKYMRQNRLIDAKNFLHDLLKFVSSKSNITNIDWSVLCGPTIDTKDINYINSAMKEKYLQDIMGESRICWMDVTLLECKLKLFYELTSGDYVTCRECILKLKTILSGLNKSLINCETLIIQSYYYRFIECETRSCLAYSIVKSNAIGYAAYAGLALEHCRKSMKLDPFHSFSHAMYGYLLDRCLDKYEEARQYLEYAIHLNNYYDNVNLNINQKDEQKKDTKQIKDKKKDKSYHRFAYIHIWLATLLINFEEEFRDIEYKMEMKLRAEFKKKYEQALYKKNNKTPRERRYTYDENDDDNNDNNKQKDKPKMTSGTRSAFLVKQLSHAHAFHRQRESLTKHLLSQFQHSNGGSLIDGSIDFNTINSPISPQTYMQSHQSSTSDTANNNYYSNLSQARSPSVSIDGSGVTGDFPVPQPSNLIEEQSVAVQSMISQRLNDDTLGLVKNIGDRFGNEFMDQMSTISDKSSDHFLLALKLEPQNGRFHSVYGVFLLQSEKWDLAKPHFEKAIKYDPNNIVSLNNLGYILSLSRFSQYQQAKNYLMKAAKLRPKNASIQFNLARLLAHAFGDEQIQNAKRYYLAALMNDNNNSHIHYFYSLFLIFIVKDSESAKKHLQKSKQYLNDVMSENQEYTDMTFEVNGYIEHAKTLQHESKFKAARFLLKRAAQLDITKKREIQQLLKSIEEEEKELNMLKRGY